MRVHREIRSVVGLQGGSATSVVLYSGLRVLRIRSRIDEVLRFLQLRRFKPYVTQERG